MTAEIGIFAVALKRFDPERGPRISPPANGKTLLS